MEIVGYLAGTLTTASFLPQAYKVIVSKNAEGISLFMYIIFTLGVLCWTVYAIHIDNMPMLIFNGLTLLLSVIILYNVIRYQKKT